MNADPSLELDELRARVAELEADLNECRCELDHGRTRERKLEAEIKHIQNIAGDLVAARLRIAALEAERDALGATCPTCLAMAAHVGCPTAAEAWDVIMRSNMQNHDTIQEQFNKVKEQAHKIAELREALKDIQNYIYPGADLGWIRKRVEAALAGLEEKP
jgi:DNA repair exonuclease SbcCD ATPase subunit